MILCSNPKAQYLTHKDEIDFAVRRVLSGGQFVLGKNVREFEKEFAVWSNSKYAIALGNGTQALDGALKALDVGVGNEVIVTSRTYISSVSSIVNAGAIPIFADVDLNSQNIIFQSNLFFVKIKRLTKTTVNLFFSNTKKAGLKRFFSPAQLFLCAIPAQLFLCVRFQPGRFFGDDFSPDVFWCVISAQLCFGVRFQPSFVFVHFSPRSIFGLTFC